MNGRFYDPRLGRFLSPDNFVQMPDFSQNYNRYSYCLNNPLVFTDPDGEFIFTALLTPIGLTTLGVMLDAACWGGAIDLGIQGIQIATGTREQINWSQVGGAAVGGFVFGGMGLLAPSFTVSSTSFMKNLPAYLGKAGWAGLTGIGASGAGMLATDLFEGGGIDYSGEDYLRTMGSAGAFSFGLSFAGSMYDYASWDRFTNTEKVDILKRKFDADIRYNAFLGAKGQYTPGNTYFEIGPAGLTSRGQGFYTSSHELKHLSDWNKYTAGKLKIPTRRTWRQQFEIRAHKHSMRRWSTSYDLWIDRYNVISGRGGYSGYGYKGPVFSFGMDQLYNFFY